MIAPVLAVCRTGTGWSIHAAPDQVTLSLEFIRHTGVVDVVEDDTIVIRADNGTLRYKPIAWLADRGLLCDLVESSFQLSDGTVDEMERRLREVREVLRRTRRL